MWIFRYSNMATGQTDKRYDVCETSHDSAESRTLDLQRKIQAHYSQPGIRDAIERLGISYALLGSAAYHTLSSVVRALDQTR